MGYFERTLERIKAIDWWALQDWVLSDPLTMINEHFRRMALWFKVLEVEETYWHI